jgi:hypothetical protein
MFALIPIVKGLIIDPKTLRLLDTDLVKPLTLKIVTLTINIRFDYVVSQR